MSLNRLAYRVVVGKGSAAPRGALYVLHGFLGSGRNWSSIARRLVDLRPDWRVVLADLRLHGDSRATPGPHDIGACAGDVRRLRDLIGGRDLHTALLGHSFGGKVGLAVSGSMKPPPIQTWVIDSTPEPTAGDSNSARMLDLVARSPDQFETRDDAVAWILSGGFDEATARWMAMNLKRLGESWVWQLDVSGLEDLRADFARSDLWSAVEESLRDTDLRFVYAESGSILSTGARDRLARLEAQDAAVSVTGLRGGHWLHIDNPDGLLQLMADHLPRL
ncbi:MAG: alpha/beta fold hydrolase [Gemmatimonadota bacterium]